MSTKIFETSNGAKVMVMETEALVEYYLRINSSDWHFCCGCQENFDEVEQDDAECIAGEYYDIVNDDERLVSEVAEVKMKYMLKN